MDQISKREKEIIEYQLKRKPDNLGGIVKYCPFGKPAILLTLPYARDKGVFPTSYWLSCPYLVKEVSRLEDQGFIRKLTLRLQTDQLFKAALEEAHYQYAQRRISYLDKKDRKNIETQSPAILDVLEKSGIAGIREKAGVKCLHAHLADFLVNGYNPVGKIIWKVLAWPQDCKICELGDEFNEGRHN